MGKASPDCQHLQIKSTTQTLPFHIICFIVTRVSVTLLPTQEVPQFVQFRQHIQLDERQGIISIALYVRKMGKSKTMHTIWSCENDVGTIRSKFFHNLCGMYTRSGFRERTIYDLPMGHPIIFPCSFWLLLWKGRMSSRKGVVFGCN